MLEDQVAYLLQRYLGNYVRGLNKEALKISVWQGDVELTNMQLKPEALNALKLPVKVKAGFLGSVRLKVPWSRLGQDPVLVYLDRIFLLAEPATQVEGSNEDAIQEVKKSRIREMEMKLLESRQQLSSEMNKSWLGSLINTVIGNLKLSISNIHIRYEDLESNPGHPFAAGVTLDRLSAFTVDDKGEETFITGGALERIQKSVELERIAIYLDSDISPWHVEKPWEDLLPSEWGQIFKFGTKDGKPAVSDLEKHSYVLQPVSGNAKYSKDLPDSSTGKSQPLQQAAVDLDDVTLCLSKNGYRDLLKLADNFTAFNQRLKYAHYRPRVSVKTDPRSWWKYACRAVSDQMKTASGKLSWEQVLRYARLRKKYISLYAALLKSDLDRAIVDDNEEIEELDQELDFEIILQWRMLAHKFVEQSVGSGLYLKKQKANRPWWSFGWSSQPAKDENEPGTLSEEDWERLNDIIGYKEADDEQLFTHDDGDFPYISLKLQMKHNASKLIDSQALLADLSCDNLECCVRLYSEAKIIDIKLGSYRLSSPNGLLAESESASDSLVGVFRYKPLDADVDWSVVAKASPCYVTYLKDSINQIINFFQSGTTVSQTLVQETASAVQMTIDEVKRTAAERMNRALRDRTRFFLDLDIAAPKITIPTEFYPDGVHPTKLLIDLGNLIIRSQDDADYGSPEEINMYTQFNLVLRDVSAFLLDGDYSWSQAYLNRTNGSSKHSFVSFLPVVDKCGVFLKLQQIRSPAPSFPSTRLAMRLPSIGFHFSPSRYHRLMQVARIFQGEELDHPDLVRPWDEADFAGWLYLLTRKGVGGREGIWQRRYFCIVGPSLYVLENPDSRNYKRYFSLRGKQLYQVPSDFLGNVEHVLAVCDAEHSHVKVVEDSNALILRCDSENSRRIWQSYLQGAIYRASVAVTLSMLSFYCRRPTILAIMEFVNAINTQEDSCETFSDSSLAAVAPHDTPKEVVNDGLPSATMEEPVVKSLLGSGKSRVIFCLLLRMARAEIFLMKEDNSKLATLAQDNFLTDIKVFPSSFSIKASLGNLRISDDSLPSSHMYFWACDMRNPGGNSFVELVFCSFNADDEDYEGYDYSLLGQLSEVRIVYLNRFLQEVISYFMGLVPSNSKDVIQIKDHATNSEKWLTRSEIEGSPALKLDVSLKKPIILMPQRTNSSDYLKLDVVQINVQNSFRWFGGSKSEIKAVHMEILEILVEDINLNVGSGSALGESIIQNVKGISFIIRRSLRDLLHQIPSIEVAITIEELKAALSNKEYEVIIECAHANISETPNSVPPLKDESFSPSIDVVGHAGPQGLDPATSGTQAREMWVATKISVHIDMVELCLHYGITRDAPLATLQVAGVWLLYKSNTVGEGLLSATVKDMIVVDDREGTEKELRLAIGKPVIDGYNPLQSLPENMDPDIVQSNPLVDSGRKYTPAILILDARFYENSTFLSLCIQRPQLLVALDFLLAIVEFFVPTVRGELLYDENDNSSHFLDALILDQPIFCQPSAEFSISPQKPLVADDERFDLFIYDGRGGTLYLRDRQGLNLSSPSTEALVYVGNGKKLKFRNVMIRNGLYLDSCISLGANSSYSADENDDVFLEEDSGSTSDHSSERNTSTMASQNAVSGRPTELIVELQAIGPELTFYNKSRNADQVNLSNKLLHAQMDAFCRLVLKGNTTEMSAKALDLTMESNGIRILEPFDASVKFSNASGKTSIQLSVSDIFMNFSFSLLRLFLGVEEDILSFLRTTSKESTVLCSEFDRIVTIKNPVNDQVYTFWRPRAPTGYVVLGDYLTPMDKPPTKSVIAVNTSLIRVKRPKSFTLVWAPSSSDEVLRAEGVGSIELITDKVSTEGDTVCSIWFPEAPKGYVALGCVASPGRAQPPISSVFCILASLVSPCGLRDCISIALGSRCPNLAFWRVDNAAGTLLPADSVTLSLTQRAYELRHLYFGVCRISHEKLKRVENQASASASFGNEAIQSERSSIVNSRRRFEAVATFRLIWWNQGSGSRKKLSIWRPVVPEGMVYFGDIAVRGYEPPNTCIVLKDSEEYDLYKAPSDFQLVGHIKKQRKIENISFWMPRAPPGFVTLGCVACKGNPKQSDFRSLRCIRADLVSADQFLDESIWDTSESKFTREPFSIWTVGNELGTFIVGNGLKKPSKRLAFKLSGQDIPSGSDDTVIDAEIRTFSAALFDDYGGLMVPLCNISLSGLEFSLHGRPDCLNSSVIFSLAARSYNDKYDSWEPLIEPVDGALRYRYNPNAPGAVSELQITSTRDLNLNVSISNTNMILQAYASWNNLSNVEASFVEASSPTGDGRSMIAVHQKRNYYIVPQNKLGKDIFIRAPGVRGLPGTIKMPAGDRKALKVPVPKNMLGSHLKGSLLKKLQLMVTIIVAEAELTKLKGLSSHQYIVQVHVYEDQSRPSQPGLNQQIARTRGASSDCSGSSDVESVKWNEVFFFKTNSLDRCMLEFTICETGTGELVGRCSSPLKQLSGSQGNSDSNNYLNEFIWLELSSEESVPDVQSRKIGRIRFAVLLPPRSEIEVFQKSHNGYKNSGLIQISPTRQGPWTTLRLNYGAPAACWRLGNDIVASEVTVNDENRYVNIRSLVSVRNNTDFTLDLCLKLRDANGDAESVTDESKEAHTDGSEFATDELFESQKYNTSLGWVPSSNFEEGVSGVDLPSGWEWIDEWHVDNSSVNTTDGWVYAPDFESLKWPESYDSLKYVNYARQRRWMRNRKRVVEDLKLQIIVGPLKPGEIVPLPLPCLAQSAVYVLHLKPSDMEAANQYSWSSVICGQSQDTERLNEISEIYVSTLTESERLLYCSEISGTSSNGSSGMWFCLSTQATEISKDNHSNPIRDWTIVVKAPISITNYLPLMAEISLLEMQATGHFLSCYRGVSGPGESVKVYNADIRNPLYLSLLPQRGWLPLQEAVLVSHPSISASKTISLRSSVSGRIVQIILEQTHTNEGPLQPKIIKVYSPYWLGIARCPPLSFRLVDVGSRRSKKNPLSFQTKRIKEVILEEITDEEIHEGYTIASALNFKSLGLSASIVQSGGDQFGPVKDLSALGDMDGSLDLFAYNADGNCMQLFVSSKPCPFQSIPTKVISVRPFMTFTNRVGQNILLKFSSEDVPKTLRVPDTRVSFVHCKSDGPNEIQVQMHDTDWSFPIQIVKEDTVILALKKLDGTRRFLRTEIRGYEEGSRFIVVFRLGSTNGPIRIENRTRNSAIRFRQTGFGDGAWILLQPLSTANFSWEDPYGQKVIETEVYSDRGTGIYKLDLDKSGFFPIDDDSGLFLHVTNMGDIKVVRFVKICTRPKEGSGSLILGENWGGSHVQTKMPEQGSPLELILELGGVGISVVDHRPRELAYLYMKKFFISYSTGYDGGTTSRFKLVLGYMQLDNQLPLTVMPVLLAPEQAPDVYHPVFKMTVTARNENLDGLQIYPYVYIRVIDKSWRLNIHEPIIWAFIDFFKNLQLDRLPQNSSVTQVDPEIRVDLIDISEVRLKVSLETAPAQRPHGLLGVWGPVLSAVGNAFKIQVHLRKVTHRDRFLRKSSVVSAIGNRIWRDLIHNPLHLIFSVDVLGMTSSTLASLSKGFAELSTDGQFLQLRSKQVWSRRITGVGDGIVQGTEALAQGVAFGVSGVVRKPVESARQNGLLGLAHGLGQGFLGFFVQPMSGALDFVSLTVDGIGASCSRCFEILSNKKDFKRVRNPRAIHADNVLREYSEREALGQMILHLAEASRNFGCTEIFKEPSKFASTDCYEDHFVVPYQRIVLVTNKRVMLLQCVAPDKMAERPCKITWDVPWAQVMALELAKAGFPIPSHLIIHLKSFRRGENFVRVIKCNTEQSSEESEPQAVSVCSVVRKVWKAHQKDIEQVPSSQRHVSLSWNEVDVRDPHVQQRSIITSTELSSSSSHSSEQRFVEHSINFLKVWSSERESKGRCSLCRKQSLDNDQICSIWRPVCPDGYVSIGDIARSGSHPPNVAAVYRNSDKLFASPVGYDLVWRNCIDDYKNEVSIWHPRAPEGYVSLGCVAVPKFTEPELNSVYCIAQSLCEETTFEEQKIWSAPESYPWACHIYQTRSDALHFVALRQPREQSDWKPRRVLDDQSSA